MISSSALPVFRTLRSAALTVMWAAAVAVPLRAQDGRPELLVLAASSLADVLPVVGEAWVRAGGGPVRFSFDATSRLAPQAVGGAPADLFFAADEAWMAWLVEHGAVREAGIRAFLGNDLVVVVPAGRSHPTNARALSDLKRVALAGENVPAGRYAREALESAEVWGEVEGRIVRGGSVRGTLEWVARGEVDAGVVYRTDAAVEPRVEVAFDFPAGSHTPIRYPAAVLDGAPSPEEAAAFLDFASGPVAREAFRAAGFRLETADRAAAQDSGESGSGAVPRPRSAIGISLWVALMASLTGLPPAVALGWLLARRDFPGKSLLSTVILAPLVIPPVVTGFLLLSALGSQSPLGRLLADVGLPVPFTLLGATLAALVVGFPLYVLSVRNAFEAVDPHYEEVSWTLGAPPARTFGRISLPLALPGIAAGGVLAFARALGEFGATVVLAGNVEGDTRTIALAVYTLLESPGGHGEMWTLVGASLILSLGALLGYEALSRRQRRRLEVHGGE